MALFLKIYRHKEQGRKRKYNQVFFDNPKTKFCKSFEGFLSDFLFISFLMSVSLQP